MNKRKEIVKKKLLKRNCKKKFKREKNINKDFYLYYLNGNQRTISE